MVIRELVTKFGFDVDENKLEEIEKGVEQLKVGLVGLTALVAASTAALFGMVKVSANAADGIKDTAIAVGTTTDALQELGYAALLNGSNMEELSTGLRFLARNAAQAAQDKTSDLAKEFRNLGVRVTDANGRVRASDALFLDLSDAMSKVQDPAKKVDLAMTLLGRSGTKLIQTMNLGAKGIQSFTEELRQSGGFLDEEAIERLAAFNDAWDKIFALFSGIRNSVAAELAPLLTDMIDTFREWIRVNGQFIKQKTVEVFRAFAWWLKVVFNVGMAVADMFISLAKHIGGVEFVTKLLLVALTALAGVAIVAGLKILIATFWGLATAIVAALAPLALVAAKVIAIGALIFLVAEDIYRFFTGGDSVTGVIVQAFVDAWAWIKRTFNAGMNWLHQTLTEWANWFAGWFTEFTAPFVNFMKWLGDGLKEFLGPMGNIRTNVNATGSLTGITPRTAPVGGGINNNQQQSVRVDAPISVTVPPGTDPAQVPGALENGLRLGIEDIFRQTNRVSAPGVGY